MSTVLFIVVGGYAAICLLVFLMQPRLLYHPSTRLDATPEVAGLAFEEVRFSAADQTRLHGWFVPAEKPESGPHAAPVSVFCHGNAGNISHRLETLKILNEIGVSVLIFDYRGYGQSQGTPSEKGTAQDAAAAFDWLTARGVAPERIIAWGRSLGGAVAAQLASDRSPGALILESTFTSVPDMGARAYPFLPVRLLARYSYNTRRLMPSLQLPVLVAHSPHDEIVPYFMGEEVFAAANQPKIFFALQGGHNDGFLRAEIAYKTTIVDFLKKSGMLQ